MLWQLATKAAAGDEEAMDELLLKSDSSEMGDMSPDEWVKHLTATSPDPDEINLSMGYDPDHPSIEEDPGMKTDPYPDNPDWDLDLDAQFRRDNRPYRPTPGANLVPLARQAKDGSEAAMEDLLLQTDPTEMGKMTPEQWVDHLISLPQPEQPKRGAQK